MEDVGSSRDQDDVAAPLSVMKADKAARRVDEMTRRDPLRRRMSEGAILVRSTAITGRL